MPWKKKREKKRDKNKPALAAGFQENLPEDASREVKDIKEDDLVKNLKIRFSVIPV